MGVCHLSTFGRHARKVGCAQGWLQSHLAHLLLVILYGGDPLLHKVEEGEEEGEEEKEEEEEI